ncbi:MAG: cyclic pyranopterin monophosphate synthase MoaC [Deltaproteobacteria bacterium]|nr:cyclic pyranopterin monophosphate synthase MoaC [Deltaproteobacteria bacterium]
MARLTHTNARGEARMVDVASKAVTAREARARVLVRMTPATLGAITSGEVPKGDVLAVARIAGIQAAKRTPELIPLCHAIALSSCEVRFEPSPETGVLGIETVARATDRTGVEMEALVAASVAALTVYDMVKAIERSVTIDSLALVSKRGGKSGAWVRGDQTRRR